MHANEEDAMSDPASATVQVAAPQRRLGRSVWAVLAGFLAVVILSLATDIVLRQLNIFPPLGQRMADRLFLWATIYRIVYGALGSYLTARLAPNRPMWHAMIGALVGMILGSLGAALTWNKDMGPHWYPLALIVTAIPCAWIGAKIREAQTHGPTV
jgi:hypothetical protein